jgi:hypothetical protein
MTSTLPRKTDAPALLAIAIAAHRTGDRELERAAKRELKESHGVGLRFLQPRRGAGHA